MKIMFQFLVGASPYNPLLPVKLEASPHLPYRGVPLRPVILWGRRG